MYEHLQKWGSRKQEVKFFLRHEDSPTESSDQGSYCAELFLLPGLFLHPNFIDLPLLENVISPSFKRNNSDIYTFNFRLIKTFKYTLKWEQCKKKTFPGKNFSVCSLYFLQAFTSSASSRCHEESCQSTFR